MKTALGVGLAAAAILAAAVTAGQAQAGPAVGAGAGEGNTILATGGSSDNKTDVLWVLTKVKPVRGPERMVLSMYQVEGRGQGFAFRGARMLDADIRCIDFQAGGKMPTVADVLKALPPEEQAVLKPQNP
jgi:hypothetical protein